MGDALASVHPVRRFSAAVVSLLGVVVGVTALPTQGSLRLGAAPSADIVVTIAGDAGGASCPGDACTLRAAIDAANAVDGETPLTIGFDPAVFKPDSPAVISIADSPLPALTRTHLVVDGSGAGVVVRGASQNLSGATNGLTLAGDNEAVRGLAVEHFSGACVIATGVSASIGGDSSLAQGLRVGDCTTGIDVHGADALVAGNRVGFAEDGSSLPVEIGVLVAAGGVTVGNDGEVAGFANIIGNAQVGVRVGAGLGAAFSGARVVGNTVGRDTSGGPAPVLVSVELRQPSTGTVVGNNLLADAATAISVAPDADDVSVAGNRFQQNAFQALTGLAIDLDADGESNPNDTGDTDTGANGLINHPVITRAVQSRITGSACAACSVQLYLADHRTGSPNDYGSVPVAGGTTTADSSGDFAFDGPAVTPGQWVTALVTDADGNTSEFGPSARVGTGLGQCGNITLEPGWNHAGFFGPDPVTLASVFPENGGVSAIYHLIDGTSEFEHWFANGGPRTLTTLQPGEAYWFYADEEVTLTAGFSLSVSLPVPLVAGWNDFVYIGASAEVPDAFQSIAGSYHDLFQWAVDDEASRWLSYGGPGVPAWARDFSSVETCGAYEVYVDAPGLLIPLQP